MTDETRAIAPGAGAALITLFGESGRLLEAETAQHAQQLVDHGARSILVAGTAGEFWSLSDEERVALIGAVRRQLPAGVPVIGHVGGVPADRAAALARAATAEGADAVVALPLGIEDGQLPAYYEGICDAAGVPTIAYHLPQAGANIPLDVLRDLGVAATKDSSGDGERLAEEVLELGLEVYTGAPSLLGLSHDLGAAGAVMGITNVLPELTSRAIEGDRDALREVAAASPASARNFPAGLKEMTAQRWGTPTASR